MQKQPNMMKQVQQMQERMADIQKELAVATVVGNAGGDAVSVTANGEQEIVSITIASGVVDEGPEMVADLVMAACNDALKKSRAAAAEQMSKLTAGLGLPPGLL